MQRAEDGLDLRLPYRIGWPTLPILPLRFKYISDERMSQLCPGAHRSTLRKILEDHHVNIYDFRFVERYRDPPFPREVALPPTGASAAGQQAAMIPSSHSSVQSTSPTRQVTPLHRPSSQFSNLGLNFPLPQNVNVYSASIPQHQAGPASPQAPGVSPRLPVNGDPPSSQTFGASSSPRGPFTARKPTNLREAIKAHRLAQITLLITVHELGSTCRTALIEIRRFCIKKNWSFSIEILTIPATINGLTFPIRPEQHKHLVQKWEGKLREKVLKTLSNSNTPWIVIDVYLRGLHAHETTESNSLPTVMISAPPPQGDATYRIWFDRILPALENDLEKSQFRVELLYTTMEKFLSTGKERYLPREDSFEPKIPFGSSCGISGNATASGTLGGAIQMKMGDEQQMFALTNFHVVLADGEESDLLAAKAEAIAGAGENDPKHHIGLNHELVSNQKLKITAPSQEDKELFIESCRQTVEIHRERIAILENEPEYLSRRSQIPGKQEEIRGMEAMIQKAERLDSEAGWVFAASGFTTTDWLGMPWIVDWSLVRLADKRSMENTFTSDRIFPVKFAFDFYSAQTPVGDQIVYKVGRSDQSNRVHLEGNINGIWSDVAAQLPNGVPKFGSTARCISILPTGQDEFCKSGDSGSILLLVVPKEDPVWFGLTFGSANGQGLRHGYATPIKAVFKHIEEVAGEGVKVVYPRELP